MRNYIAIGLWLGLHFISNGAHADLVQPSDLQLTVLSPFTVQLQWLDNSVGETKYLVKRTSSLSVPFFTVATLPPDSQSYIDTVPRSEETYYYQVVVLNSSGAGILSRFYGVTMPALPYPRQMTMNLLGQEQNGGRPSAEIIFPNIFHLYSATVFENNMLMGGWGSKEDFCQADDRLYASQFNGTNWSPPTPINWLNQARPGSKSGYHINDPTVIKHPVHNWHYMYFTALNNVFATPTEMTLRNWIGFASSSDGGKTWYDHDIILGQDNGLDQHGAVSPSALVSEAEQNIWLYYHTNWSPQVFRSRFDLNGWQRLDTMVMKSMVGAPLVLTNVDVIKDGSRYLMVGNDSTLKTVQMYVSLDGVYWRSWSPDQRPLIAIREATGQLDPNITLLTPHLRKSNLAANTYDLYFTYHDSRWLGPVTNCMDLNSYNSMHHWTIQLNEIVEPESQGLRAPISSVSAPRSQDLGSQTQTQAPIPRQEQHSEMSAPTAKANSETVPSRDSSARARAQSIMAQALEAAAKVRETAAKARKALIKAQKAAAE